LIESNQFAAEDQIVYSGLLAYRSGRIEAIVQVKMVGDMDYGGDYCEFVGGEWRQVGLVPNPDVEVSEEFIANPLSNDPSFCSEDYRDHHRRGFLSDVGKLQQNTQQTPGDDAVGDSCLFLRRAKRGSSRC
jgi:hypothetical protein